MLESEISSGEDKTPALTPIGALISSQSLGQLLPGVWHPQILSFVQQLYVGVPCAYEYWPLMSQWKPSEVEAKPGFALVN